ncbi:MAG: leucine-rich repeat domain-containing protein [Promethearchaeota archaeon]
MSEKKEGSICDSCGLSLGEAPMRSETGHLLCFRCTLNATTKPTFAIVVAAVAMGYFMTEKSLTDPQEALYQAHEFVTRMPYWRDKDHFTPSLERLIMLLPDMNDLNYVEELLEPHDFFISHKHSEELDELLVEPLIAALKDLSYRIWYDKSTRVTKSDTVDEWTKRGIHQSKYCVIVFHQRYFSNEPCVNELDQILGIKDPKLVFPIWWTDIDADFLKQKKQGEQLLNRISIKWNDYQGNIDKLTEKLVQLVKEVEGLKEYEGVSLVTNEVQVLERLQLIIERPIPSLGKSRSSNGKSPLLPAFGFYHEKNQITGLFLENTGLNTIPTFLGQLKALKQLNLARNQLTTLPDNFGITKLETLNLSGNPILSLPQSFTTNFENIIRSKYPEVIETEAAILLMLEWQIGQPIPQVSEIGYGIFGFILDAGHVTGLGLYNQGLDSLPRNIDQLRKLSNLDLSYNNLNALPESIGNLEELKWLSLRDNRFTSLPETIGNLKKLEWIKLEHNHMKSLPKAIGKLTELQTLELQDNELTSLPESFGNLKNLETLLLWQNQLHSLPKSFSNLITLQNLDLTSNKLESLPETFGNLRSLEYLDLESNQLNVLPESFGMLFSLQELYLQENQLASLPESFGNLPNLRKLYLHLNQLTALPGNFGNLRNLQSLRLHNNQLTSLPETFGNLTSLIDLNLKNNILSWLPETFGNLLNIQTLDLRNNQLTQLPQSFSNLIKLEVVWLYNNQLMSLPESFFQLLNLRTLSLGHNQLNSLPKDFQKLANLEELNLAVNRLESLPESVKILQRRGCTVYGISHLK